MSRNRKRDEAELPPTEVEGPRRRPRPLPASEGHVMPPRPPRRRWRPLPASEGWDLPPDDWMDDEEMEDEPRDPPTQ
jgi:hypothetical protein